MADGHRGVQPAATSPAARAASRGAFTLALNACGATNDKRCRHRSAASKPSAPAPKPKRGANHGTDRAHDTKVDGTGQIPAFGRPLLEGDDPRDPRGRRWGLDTLLTTLVLASAAGGRSLAQAETLTADLSPGAKRLTAIARRVPDSTLRETACRLDPAELRRSPWRPSTLRY